VVRYRGTGEIDRTFAGGDGMRFLHPSDLSRQNLEVHEAVRDRNGRILFTDHAWRVYRLLPGGTSDPDFGEGGVSRTFFSRGINGLGLTGEGKILLGGQRNDDDGRGYDPVIDRLHNNGAIDRSFGEDGSARVESPNDRSAHLADLAIQKDGKIVFAGTGFIGGEQHILVARLTRTGEPDPAFGPRRKPDGVIQVELGGNSSGEAVLVQPNGRILVAAAVYPGGFEESVSRYGVLRYLPNGRLDPSWSGDGIALTRISGRFYFPTDLGFRRGKIYTTGMVRVPVNGEWRPAFGLFRYLSNGRLDRSFSGDGIATRRVGKSSAPGGLAIQRSGNVVVGGETPFRRPESTSFALARFLGG